MNHFPWWLKRRYISQNREAQRIKSVINRLSLNTVCVEARCPNTSECFSHHNITFLILGDICTRRCKFCNISQGKPKGVDEDEPGRITKAAKQLALKHIVITSVTRDDLDDGGAHQFITVIKFLKKEVPSVVIEILTPDFKGKRNIVISVVNSQPDIFAHNIETVPRLYRKIRPQADYCKSLKILETAKKGKKKIYVKSGIMVGMGERKQEVIEVMRDLRIAGCDILTIGQYLQPNKSRWKIADFVHPDTFKDYKQKAYDLGFVSVASGPFVRSSYNSRYPFTVHRSPKKEILRTTENGN